MYTDIYEQIKTDPAFQNLVKKRQKTSLLLTAIILVVYFSFILTLAYAPELFAITLAQGSVITLGIPIGLGIILIAFLLTGVYVKKANSDFDATLKRLKEDVGVSHE